MENKTSQEEVKKDKIWPFVLILFFFILSSVVGFQLFKKSNDNEKNSLNILTEEANNNYVYNSDYNTKAFSVDNGNYAYKYNTEPKNGLYIIDSENKNNNLNASAPTQTAYIKTNTLNIKTPNSEESNNNSLTNPNSELANKVKKIVQTNVKAQYVSNYVINKGDVLFKNDINGINISSNIINVGNNLVIDNKSKNLFLNIKSANVDKTLSLSSEEYVEVFAKYPGEFTVTNLEDSQKYTIIVN